MIHPVLDCVLDWRRDNPQPKSTRVVVRGNPLLGVRTDRPNISTGRESQVSVQHAVAAALVTGKAGLDQFTDACVRDPGSAGAAKQGRSGSAIRAFSTIAAAVEITTADGKIHKLSQAAARGSDVNPLTTPISKTSCAPSPPAGIRGYDTAPLIDAIWALDKSDGCFRMASSTVPAGACSSANPAHGRTAGASTGMPLRARLQVELELDQFRRAVIVGLGADAGDAGAQPPLQRPQRLPLQPVERIAGRVRLGDRRSRKALVPIIVVAIAAAEIELALSLREQFASLGHERLELRVAADSRSADRATAARRRR